MNAPWFPPDQIDWQDALNPLAMPAFREQRNPAVYRALQSPTMIELRNTPGLALALYAMPDAPIALAANSTNDYIVELPPASWLIGVSANSSQAAGARAQITMPTGSNVFSAPIKFAELNARPHYLQQPQGSNGGAMKIRIINLAGAANLAQLVAWVIQPA